jgi:hypothetical protein
MATDPAAAPVTRPAPPRRLWQVPTFLVGAAVFAAAYQGLIPVRAKGPNIADDLAALVAATDRLSPDASELKNALARVASEAQHYPELGAAVHVALGGGYTRLAELTADGGEARGYWGLARQHYAAVEDAKVPEADRPKFAFRRAKAVAAELPATTTPAEIELFRTILSMPPLGEDPGDAPRLAAELSLRLTPPDLKAAKQGFTTYLTGAGLSAPPGPLARAKLQLSLVCLKLGEFDGAKQWLTAIGPDAPPDVLPYAKAQLARVRMAENDWAGAAREWEAARAAPDLPPALRTASAYFLADCRLHTRPDDADAAKLLEEAAKATTPEGPAAAVRLAALSLKNPDPNRRKAAVGYLAVAARGVKGSEPAVFELLGGPNSPGRGAVEFQAAFEQAVQVLTADGAYPEAVAAAEAYAPVAAGGKDREKKADVLAAWAAAEEKAGADGKARFAAAAAEYAALAAARPDGPLKAENLRRAAGFHRKAGNPAAGLDLLQKAAAVPKLPDEVAGPVWADYAEGLLAANRPDDALKAFNAAMQRSGPTSTAARHKLARNLIDSRDPKKVPLGLDLLEQIANAEQVSPAEQEYQEKALVELADEAVRGGDFPKAEARLRTQLRLYPAGPENDQARLLLGTALLQRAAPNAKTPAVDADKSGEEALGLFKQVLADVHARKIANRPAANDTWLRTQANLRVLLGYVLLRKPYDVQTTAEPLLQEYAGTVEELIVLSMLYHSFRQLNNDNGRLTVESRMREAFNKIKDRPGAFPARSGEYSRDYWERNWFSEAATVPKQ